MDRDAMNSRLASVLERIRVASSKCAQSAKMQPRLVAVSKTKPVEAIIEAYSCGQKHFGENYIAELVSKASDTDLQSKCPDVRWHFIGQLQSNKINMLSRVPNLFAVETIHTIAHAKKLNNAWTNYGLGPTNKLKVFIQVNTSQESEDTKNGCSTDQVVEICDFVRQQCSSLEMTGLMTIGSAQNSLLAATTQSNPDFTALMSCKEKLCAHYGGEEFARALELSMGMSADFETAIIQGSTNVRVGSLIFGERTYNK